jgi:predicted membrane-bound dolichyl-phosphate-mannose-protein mannosyltransferase
MGGLKVLSVTATPAVTAGLRPELFAPDSLLALKRKWLVIALAVLVLVGFGLRAASLSTEGLSEDEYNKLAAVADYRAHGLTPANGEHPFLMKALQTASVVAFERWNNTALVAAHQATLNVPIETALRLPSAIFGALTVVVLYLLTAELFGGEVALIAAALWAFDPNAIGFNRIAKEDTFLLFFFLLANVLWLRSQRIAETGKGDPQPYYWATAVAFGAMMASKYLPGYFAVAIAYYGIFQAIPATRWRLGKPRFLLFFFIIGVSFVVFNLPILLPGTWRAALSFASYKRIGHDSYEFIGRLYTHKLADWFKGVPWYFYFVFVAVKTPIPTLIAFLAGLPLLFRRRLGDGRFFIFFWLLLGFLPFVLVGGKFTRYFTPVLPIVLITAAIGLQFIRQRLAHALTATSTALKTGVPIILAALVLLASLWSAVQAAPHYRLYTNLFGGGQARAGYYFPQDEFYDVGLREALVEIARRARPGARVANETPSLTEFYAQQAKRPDLISLSLSDPDDRSQLNVGDFVIAARGRRYFSNDAILSALRQTSTPVIRIDIGAQPAVEVYLLDEQTAGLANGTK